ncbi:MAG: Uma2 family endonuclease [Bacteroidota bacterium]|nr:Uma2 family endonuclease [Bacteroidota bacterium]
MESILEKIIDSPKLEIYSKEIANILNEEHKMRKEFYITMVEGEKVEFINGEVVFNSPVKSEHNLVGVLLSRLLSTFIDRNELGYLGYDKIMISLTRNDYEPDICFFNKSISDQFNPKQMQFPAPDFIVEIVSPSTEHNDRIVKFEDYAAHGIKEYWIIDPDKQIIEQYILNNDKYELFLKSNNGLIKSKAIQGFEIPIESVFIEEQNLKALKKIIN